MKRTGTILDKPHAYRWQRRSREAQHYEAKASNDWAIGWMLAVGSMFACVLWAAWVNAQ